MDPSFVLTLSNSKQGKLRRTAARTATPELYPMDSAPEMFSAKFRQVVLFFCNKTF
jgi:hypothetical protein